MTVYFIAARFDYRFTKNAQVIVPMYLAILLTLILILVFGTEINNAKRWIIIGNFQLQPSEFAKIGLIMTTAWLFSLKDRVNVWRLTIISGILTAIAAVLVFSAPDLGMAVIIVAIWALMAFAAIPNQLRTFLIVLLGSLSAVAVLIAFGGISVGLVIVVTTVTIATAVAFIVIKQYKIVIAVAIILGIVLGLGTKLAWDHVIPDYQKERVEAFQDPESNTQGSAFQVNQSKVAIGSGKLLGKGFGHGTQSKLNFLPEHQTDFVFAAFAEEFGLVGGVFVLILYVVAVLRIVQISTKTSDMYGSLICIGIAGKILLEVFINVGMNLGIVPATGVPLPLMSAGGSMFLATMLALGLVQSVFIHRELIDEELSL